MEPQYNLLRKETNFAWSLKCQEAYDTIKKEITPDSVLVHFNPALPIILTTDASANAVSLVLSHKVESSLKPVAFASRSL